MDIKIWKNEITTIFKNHNRVFIYGAGVFAKKITDMCREIGYEPAGFIVTKREKREYMSLPVFCVEDIEREISMQDGIIPAFRGADTDVIRNYFLHDMPDIIKLSLKPHCDLRLNPVLYELMEEVGRRYPLEYTEGNAAEWKNILVTRLDMIGDVVCTTALLRELKKGCPDAKVTVVVRRQNKELLEYSPYLDKLLAYDVVERHKGIFAFCNSYRECMQNVELFVKEYLANFQYDVVIVGTEAFCGRYGVEEYLLACASGAKERIGYLVMVDEMRDYLYPIIKEGFSKLYFMKEPRHECGYLLDMIRGYGIRAYDEHIRLFCNPNHIEEAETELAKCFGGKDCIKIAVALVASKPVRNWNMEYFKRVFAYFLNRYPNVRFLLFGAKDAVEAAGKLASSDERIWDFTGKLSIGRTMAYMKQCSMYLGPSTGLSHIATALGLPSVIMYNALTDTTDMCDDGPYRWGPQRWDSIALLPKAGFEGCHDKCKKVYAHCINLIEPEEAIAAMRIVLKRIM